MKNVKVAGLPAVGGEKGGYGRNVEDADEGAARVRACDEESVYCGETQKEGRAAQ